MLTPEQVQWLYQQFPGQHYLLDRANQSQLEALYQSQSLIAEDAARQAEVATYKAQIAAGNAEIAAGNAEITAIQAKIETELDAIDADLDEAENMIKNFQAENARNAAAQADPHLQYEDDHADATAAPAIKTVTRSGSHSPGEATTEASVSIGDHSPTHYHELADGPAVPLSGAGNCCTML